MEHTYPKEPIKTVSIRKIPINDSYELVNKAVGSWLREAGKVDDRAKTMPRVTFRYAVEKLDKVTKTHYMMLGK